MQMHPSTSVSAHHPLKNSMAKNEDWIGNFYQQMCKKSDSRHDGDVVIWCGKHKILAHKFVLDVNSTVMKVENARYLSTNGLFEVYLPTEFDVCPDDIADIITSFYIGSININKANVKLVYKFAVLYSVIWVAKAAREVFETLINKNNFLCYLKYAHTVCCDDLKNTCLQYLDETIKCGEFSDMDYYCFKTISQHQRLSPIKKFEIITGWYIHDIPNRSCHIESLLLGVPYQLIDNDVILGLVQPWIFDADGLDEITKFRLIKTISNKIKDGKKATEVSDTGEIKKETSPLNASVNSSVNASVNASINASVNVSVNAPVNAPINASANAIVYAPVNAKAQKYIHQLMYR